jgi:hypothetical protein
MVEDHKTDLAERVFDHETLSLASRACRLTVLSAVSAW